LNSQNYEKIFNDENEEDDDKAEGSTVVSNGKTGKTPTFKIEMPDRKELKMSPFKPNDDLFGFLYNFEYRSDVENLNEKQKIKQFKKLAIFPMHCMVSYDDKFDEMKRKFIQTVLGINSKSRTQFERDILKYTKNAIDMKTNLIKLTLIHEYFDFAKPSQITCKSWIMQMCNEKERVKIERNWNDWKKTNDIETLENVILKISQMRTDDLLDRKNSDYWNKGSFKGRYKENKNQGENSSNPQINQIKNNNSKGQKKNHYSQQQQQQNQNHQVKRIKKDLQR